MTRRALFAIGLLTIATAMIMHGCASRPLPAVDDHLLTATASIAPPQRSIESIRRGRELLVTDCAYCHTPVYPTSISMERWERAMPRMIRRAELSPEVQADILAYVAAVRAMEARHTQGP